ncbi:MAG: hypothetical protein KCHDKBKB_01014 [Elusimicrobia bacterium]|nr:hypothetical protein [Elusimicrobiota bacterium]
MKKKSIICAIFAYALVLPGLVFGGSGSAKIQGKLVTGTAILDATGRKKVLVKKPAKDELFGEGKLSPDGNQIIFDVDLGTFGNPKHHELRVINISGNNEKVLLLARHGFDFSWSPDSKFVVARGAGDVSSLEPLIINVNTLEAWQMKLPGVITKGVSDPRWEPDGEKIVFRAILSSDPETFGYFRAGLDGQNFEIVMSTTAKLLTWTEISSDRSKIAYVGFVDESLYVWDLPSGNIKRLSKQLKRRSSFVPFWAFFELLTFSPDGEWIGTRLRTDTTSIPQEYIAWNVNSGKRKLLHTGGIVSGYQWWHPPKNEPILDCEPIVKTLLEGREVDLRAIQKELNESISKSAVTKH